jgi:uncharacterized membrane protein YfcA
VDLLVSAIGLGVGVCFGVFGAGGSAFATPLLALAGVHGIAAVASPLPATVPAALTGAWAYVRSGELDWRMARRAVLGGVPGAVVGASVSRVVGGHGLLVMSGVVLVVVGLQLARRAPDPREPTARVDGTLAVVGLGAGAGFLAGLLANAGGFLLVPMFVLVLGLGMRRAAGTSLVAAALLTVPTIATHWVMGNIDWAVTLAFALGLVPGAAIGGRISQQLSGPAVQRTFGGVLVVFSLVFVARQL